MKTTMSSWSDQPTNRFQYIICREYGKILAHCPINIRRTLRKSMDRLRISRLRGFIRSYSLFWHLASWRTREWRAFGSGTWDSTEETVLTPKPQNPTHMKYSTGNKGTHVSRLFPHIEWARFWGRWPSSPPPVLGVPWISSSTGSSTASSRSLITWRRYGLLGAHLYSW